MGGNDKLGCTFTASTVEIEVEESSSHLTTNTPMQPSPLWVMEPVHTASQRSPPYIAQDEVVR